MRQPKILFVTQNPPYPLIAGSCQRTANLIDALSQLGPVSLFIIGSPARKPFLEGVGYRVAATSEPTAQSKSLVGRVLQRLLPGIGKNIWRTLAGVKVDFTPDPGLSETLTQLLKREHFDLVVGRYLIPSVQSGSLELGYPPVIVDVDDADSKSVAAKINSPASGLLMRNILRTRLAEVRRREKMLFEKTTKLWFSNPDDLALAPGMGADVIPNIPYEIPPREELEHSHPDSKTILWVGSFNHRVNMEGVELFLRKAWNDIRRVNPEVRFRIVGSHLPDAVRDKWSAISGVDVVGFAESLRQHYAEAAFSIVPLMDGAGTKIKVLESLGYLRTCVVTTHSIAGFEDLLRDRESVRTVAGLDELAGAISDLLNHPQTRHAMENNGRAIIEKHFSRDMIRNSVRQSVLSLLK
ncbi:MAG: glycosyltransferase family 4 protein [Gammaproteobacteria bacterium]|nr:glycosyltransferase family 4 protein [Gammaproteobacteria bacterium]